MSRKDPINSMAKDALRIAAVAALIKTYDTASERVRVIDMLRRKGVIKPETADLFVEEVVA